MAAAVWDSGSGVSEGTRPRWAAAVLEKRFAAGVAYCRQDARAAFDAAAQYLEDNLTVEFRRENGGPAQGWRPVKKWEDVDVLLEQGFAVQQRVIGPWMYLDDGSNGKGNLDARLAIS